MKLMVSLDAGCSYHERGTGSLEELQAKAEGMRLDERMLRWVIESDDGSDILEVSAIHKDIIDFMTRAREAER